MLTPYEHPSTRSAASASSRGQQQLSRGQQSRDQQRGTKPATLDFLAALTAFFWLTAVILMLIGLVLCDFVQFTAEAASESEPAVSRGFGLWGYRHWSAASTSADGTVAYLVESCAAYPLAMRPDAAWQAARAFAVLAVLFALLVLVFKFGVSFTKDGVTAAKRERCAAPLFLLVALCQGLTLLFLRSDACRDNLLVELGALDFPATCRLSTGARLCIASMVFWLLAALSSIVEQRIMAKLYPSQATLQKAAEKRARQKAVHGYEDMALVTRPMA